MRDNTNRCRFRPPRAAIFDRRQHEVSLQVERDADVPIAKYDKVLFHSKNAIPVDLEGNNLLFVVPVEDIVPVFRRSDGRKRRDDATGDGSRPEGTED